MQEFSALWRRFEAGTRWICQGYVQRGWTAARHGFDPKFEADIKEFEEKIIKTMDKVWAEMSEEERKAAEVTLR